MKESRRWADFVSDALGDGRKFRALTVVDDYTRTVRRLKAIGRP
jgi:hypothetical protein